MTGEYNDDDSTLLARICNPCPICIVRHRLQIRASSKRLNLFERNN
jgi:hypothetical protein